MKNGWKLGKFHPELWQKFTVFSKNFHGPLLSVLTKFCLISFQFMNKIFCFAQISQLPRLYSKGCSLHRQYPRCLLISLRRKSSLAQGILKVEESLYHWPPVWLVWNQLYDNWQFLFLYAKQTNPNQSNRWSMVRWDFSL